ncbi:hypothetical protein RHSIM_Rhsim05G0061600 [Rhododendron simsii]|uniref:F-box domain-containing protein n=1 Tax=Rhododendron simsii TaxID=118357 RepID=A0A834H2A5_RHOSS|nr:hypothetical protein RHSIM_Rhsim05G0061600 [Rhododendron simsii]
MSDSRGIGTRREGKEPIEGHASSSPETAVATGTQRLDISNVEEPEEGLESGSCLFLEPAATLRNGSEEDEVHPHTIPRRSPFFSESEPGSSLFLEPAAFLRTGSEADEIHPHTTPRRSPFFSESEPGSYLFLEPAATLRKGSEEDEIHPHTTPKGSSFFSESELGEPSRRPGKEQESDDQLRVEPSVPQFENIPEVLLVGIFSRLSEGAQLLLQAVCKSWCRLIPTVQPRGGTVYHLPTGDLLSDLASFMMSGETVKAAILRLGREKRGSMSFAVLKENMKALRETDLFKQRVVRLVSRGFEDIKEWTKEDILEAAKMLVFAFLVNVT